MPVTNGVSVQNISGVLTLHLLSGSVRNVVLSALSPMRTGVVTENNNALTVGEVVNLSGQSLEILGSGTAQSGIKVLGATVGLGPKYPVVLARDTVTGDLHLIYPESTAGLLGGVALMLQMTPKDYTFPEGILCFARGTPIAIGQGVRPVEELRAGQRIRTLDNGLQEIALVMTRHLTRAQLVAEPRLWPILVPAGALGRGVPAQALVISPQHRLLLRSRIAARIHGDTELLVAARHLVGINGVTAFLPENGVEYHHLLLERHEVIIAAGAPAETLLTGEQALRNLSRDAAAEIRRIFPDLPAGVPARQLMNGAQGRDLMRRHLQHRRPLVARSP